MNGTRTVVALGCLCATLLCRPVRAADHADGPAASADPSADITDVFAWMSPDASRVNLVMDLVRNASAASKFSDSVQYVFHTTSRAKFGDPPAPEVDVLCEFSTSQMVQCWAGDRAYAAGDATRSTGITSRDGKLRVFTGLRNDPFFFNLDGFKATGKAVADAAAALTFDPAGCPQLDAATASALVTQLHTAPGGGPPIDNFAHFNVLAIALAVDKSLLTEGGPILSVWGSTNRR
jgi:hypothetical protein